MSRAAILSNCRRRAWSAARDRAPAWSALSVPSQLPERRSYLFVLQAPPNSLRQQHSFEVDRALSYRLASHRVQRWAVGGGQQERPAGDSIWPRGKRELPLEPMSKMRPECCAVGSYAAELSWHRLSAAPSCGRRRSDGSGERRERRRDGSAVRSDRVDESSPLFVAVSLHYRPTRPAGPVTAAAADE